MNRKKIKVSAPGKIILSGEHAVVYGKPAILTTIGKRVFLQIGLRPKSLEITPKNIPQDYVLRSFNLLKKLTGYKGGLKLNIKTQVPIGCGLGSSASFVSSLAAGLMALLGKPFDQKAINEAAYQMEILQHGSPSGGDNTIVTYGGFLWFRKEAENLKCFSQITAKRKLPKLILLDSGKPLESTKEMVLGLRERYKRNKSKYQLLFNETEKVTKAILGWLLKENNEDFALLLRKNERLLEKMGVVSPSARKLVRKIEAVGGSAKISGAGGIKKGSGILIVYHKNLGRIKKLAEKEKLRLYTASFGKEGVRIEKN